MKTKLKTKWIVEWNDLDGSVFRDAPYATKAEAVSAAVAYVAQGSDVVTVRKMKRTTKDGYLVDAS